MKVYKFGGASVKDAESIKNVARVLKNQKFEHCLVVVSAFGKTTNALEIVVEKYFAGDDYKDEIYKIKQKHLQIAGGLFQKEHKVFDEIEEAFVDIESFLRRTRSPKYNFVYDQVVSYGELLSSTILSQFLLENDLNNVWLDARDFIKTDATYREGNVNWEVTEAHIKNISPTKNYVTQGFIASDDNNFTVTLGREGSDYSAAIFAYCLDAKQMTIWKDVPGVMTGDPRKFPDAELLTHISYMEAIEMAYYGASVIHPKTLQPLKQKLIPFYVKSFIHDEEPGTEVSANDSYERKESHILKENQVLMTIATRDFSFIAEDHMSYIFSLLSEHNVKASLIQNSAISLALCLEDKFKNHEKIYEALKEKFEVSMVPGVSLYTIRNTDAKNVNRLTSGKEVLIEQLASNAFQMVTR